MFVDFRTQESFDVVLMTDAKSTKEGESMEKRRSKRTLEDLLHVCVNLIV